MLVCCPGCIPAFLRKYRGWPSLTAERQKISWKSNLFWEPQSLVRELQHEPGRCFKARAVGNLNVHHAAKFNRKHKYLYSFVTKEKYGFWQKDRNGTCGFKITEPCSHYVEITCRWTVCQWLWCCPRQRSPDWQAGQSISLWRCGKAQWLLGIGQWRAVWTA